MDLSGYSDDQLKAMLDAPPAVVAPAQAAPAAPAASPDLSHLSDDQLQAMLPPSAAKPLTVHGTPVDHGATASGMAGFLDGIPVVGPKLLDLSADTGAAIATLRDGGTYADQRAKIQQNLDATRAAHPYAGTAGSIAGGVVGTAPLVAAAPGAFGVGGGSLALRSLAGAGSSAVLGGADSAARSDQQGAGRVVDAAKGALIGGAVGGVAPLAGAALGAGYRRLMGQAVQDTVDVPASARAAIVKAQAQAASLDPAGKLGELGQRGMLADVAPSFEGIAMGQAAKDGPGAPIVLDALRSRHAGTSDRVLGDVARAVGPAQNADAVARQIEDVGQAATQPYFQRAYQAGVPQGADLDGLAQRPAIAAAMRDAATNAANRGAPLPTVVLDAAGNPVASDAALQAYEAGQRPAVTGALANLLGANPTIGPLATQDALAAARKTASDPLYEAYRQMSVPMTSDLADVLNRPSTRQALAQAERKAQDQGRSIFASRASQFERDPLGSSATHEPPIDLDNIPPFQAEQAPSRPAPVGVPRPPDLHAFIRSAGGIQDRGGDLASMGYGNLIAKPGQGLGPDAMRQAAAQAGYLGADIDHATANTTVNDLFGHIESSNPIHSVFDQDAVAQWEARDAAMADFNRGGASRGEVGRDAGPRPMAPGMPFGGPDAPTGPVARAPQITPEGLDYVKRALQDKADTARQTGLKDDARIFGTLKDDLLGAIENHPDASIADAYGAARRAYAGPSREIDALNAGRASFADNVSAEQVQREYAALGTDGERQHYRNGMFSAGRDKMAKAGDTRNFVDMVAGNDAVRAKFGAVAPHQGAVDHFNAAMDRARQTFTEAQRPTPEAWHHALNVLDEKAAGGDQGAAAARAALESRLAHDADFAKGRQLQADYGNPLLPGSGALPQALEAGRTGLRGGPNAIHPEDYAEAFQGRSGAAQAAQRAGLNSDIYRQLGDKPNDLVALKAITKGDNDRSRAILATTFGQDAADRLAGTAAREGTFQETYGNVLKNSITARRQEAIAAQKAAAPEPYQISSVRSLTPTGALAEGPRLAINAILRALRPTADTTAHDVAVSKIVTATGDERNRLMAQILRAQAQEDANARLGQNAARVGTSLTALSPSVLAAALRGRQQSLIPAR